MNLRSASLVLLTLALFLGSTGCATTQPALPPEPVVRMPIPHRTWVNLNYAIKAINERAESLNTVLAVGDIVMTKPDGKTSVTLRAALLMENADSLRLKAWKADQPVMDITYTPQGVWVWTHQRSPELTFTRAALTQLAATLRGSVPEDAQQIQDSTHLVTASAVLPDSQTPVQLRIHKPTLTITQYTYFDKQNNKRQTLVLDQYDLINHQPWPRRIRAEGELGFMLITLDEVEINEPLPPAAFVPPARAIRQP